MPSISATYGFLQVSVRNVKKIVHFLQKSGPVTNCQEEQQKIYGKLNSKIATYNEGT